jgi:hypothetical protein
MTSFTAPTARRTPWGKAFAATGWVAFAALAFVDVLAHHPNAEPPASVGALQAPATAGPASPSYLNEAPEPLPPTF